MAARDLPDGDAFYRAQVREYTTTDMTPEEIHQLGIREVARIDAEMRRTIADSGFKGSFPEFLHFLKTDPQFYAKSPDELLGVSSYVAKRVDGKIGDHHRAAAAQPVRDHPGPAGPGAILHRRSRRRSRT